MFKHRHDAGAYHVILRENLQSNEIMNIQMFTFSLFLTITYLHYYELFFQNCYIIFCIQEMNIGYATNVRVTTITHAGEDGMVLYIPNEVISISFWLTIFRQTLWGVVAERLRSQDPSSGPNFMKPVSTTICLA